LFVETPQTPFEKNQWHFTFMQRMFTLKQQLFTILQLLMAKKQPKKDLNIAVCD
jgi:hypothetical protein